MKESHLFWSDSKGFIGLYLLNFGALFFLFYFLDGFQSWYGLLYYFTLSLFLLCVFLTGFYIKKRKQSHLIAKANADAQTEKEKAASYEKHYREHLLFINRWVHYIKTPLSVIQSLTQDVSTIPTAEAGEVLQQVRAQSDRILDGVNSALQFARATDFVTDFKIESFDLHQLFVDLINNLKMNFIRASVYPNLQIQPDTFIKSDRKWIEFIFFQILTNAIKYSHPEGQVTIWMEESTVCVRDTGIGISREDLPRIFDIFYTGTNGRIKGESTGIGLYMVKTICERLDCTVEAESTVGESTTLKVHLPL